LLEVDAVAARTANPTKSNPRLRINRRSVFFRHRRLPFLGDRLF
jgi:hypothetical protein